eukprot:2538039-Prymnesium_polylepis.2
MSLNGQITSSGLRLRPDSTNAMNQMPRKLPIARSGLGSSEHIPAMHSMDQCMAAKTTMTMPNDDAGQPPIPYAAGTTRVLPLANLVAHDDRLQIGDEDYNHAHRAGRCDDKVVEVEPVETRLLREVARENVEDRDERVAQRHPDESRRVQRRIAHEQ